MNPRQRQYLKGLAHNLNPVVMVGKAGYSDEVKDTLERALATHELIKVRVAEADRESFRALAAAMADDRGAALLQTIGRIAVMFRADPTEPTIRIDHLA